MLVLGFAVTANASVNPDTDTGTHNGQMCGSNSWSWINTSPVLKAHDSAGTCIDPEEYHADFSITKVTQQIGWQYPNISDGYELGDSGCYTGAVCDSFPVQWENDGTPVASGTDYNHPGGTYNDSFDIWLAPVQGQTSYQDRHNDVEIMIWLDHPGINDTSHYVRYETIDGTRWGVMTWTAGSGSQQWRYVAYLAPRTSYGTVKYSGLWLNPFFRDASAHGELGSAYWLIAIDKGFELVSGGAGNNITQYNIQDLK
jgi:hypothetical protein